LLFVLVMRLGGRTGLCLGGGGIGARRFSGR
jgi:hypothetical protein